MISNGTAPSQRIAAVFTDIENLPNTDSDKFKWLPSFCEKCNRCVNKCPAGAIFKETIIFEDGSHQHIDLVKSKNYIVQGFLE